MIKIITEVPKYALKLVEGNEENTVCVRIVNVPAGTWTQCGMLVTIAPDGIFRHSYVNEDAAKALGIPLDDEGRIKLDEKGK